MVNCNLHCINVYIIYTVVIIIVIGSPPLYHYSYPTAESLSAVPRTATALPPPHAATGTGETVGLKWLLRSACRGPWRSDLPLAPLPPMSPRPPVQRNGCSQDGNILPSFFIPSLLAPLQLPLLQVLTRKGPGCRGMWHPRQTLYCPSRGQWMPHPGICHLTCKCPWVLGEMESLLPPVASWQHHSQHHGVGGVPCWNDS